MRLRFVLLKLPGLLLLVLMLTTCQNQEKGRVLKLGHGLNIKHPVHNAMLFMAKRVEELSEGKLKIKIYHSQQLGAERQCVELLQLGSLAMTKVSAAVMEGFAPKYKVLGLPYIFENKQHANKVLDGPIGKELLLDGQKFWLRGLVFYDAGSRSFYTKTKAIEHPKDLSGLKIRVMKSITATNMVNALGGSPTPLPFGELYSGLQQGTVDGAENNPPSFYTSRHYEVCKYYSLDEHTAVPDVLLISTIIWEQLSEQERAWLQQAADESVEVQRKLWAEAEQEALEEVQKAGVKIIKPNKAPFKELVVPLYENYKTDTAIYNLIQRIQVTNQES